MKMIKAWYFVDYTGTKWLYDCPLYVRELRRDIVKFGWNAKIVPIRVLGKRDTCGACIEGFHR